MGTLVAAVRDHALATSKGRPVHARRQQAAVIVWNNAHSCDFNTQFRVGNATTAAFGACANLTACTAGTVQLIAPTTTTDRLCCNTSCPQSDVPYESASETSCAVCGKAPHAYWALLPYSSTGGTQSFTRTVTVGVSSSQGTTVGSTWGQTATNTVSNGFTAGGGFNLFGIGASVSGSHTTTSSQTVTSTIAQSFSSSFAETSTTTTSHTFSAVGSYWQFTWVFEYSNGTTVTVYTSNFATTPSADEQPCCFPDLFANDTQPQQSTCLPAVSAMGAEIGASPMLCSPWTTTVIMNDTQAHGGDSGVVTAVGCVIGIGAFITLLVFMARRFAGKPPSYSIVNPDVDTVIELAAITPIYEDYNDEDTGGYCDGCGEPRKSTASKFCHLCGQAQ